MGLYNMIHGYDPAAYLILPMLGRHESEYGRFRDCWVEPREWNLDAGQMPHMVGMGDAPLTWNRIYVYTRNGGGNREDYADTIAELRAMPTFIHDYDDAFDSTYATFVFGVPDKWQSDYTALQEGRYADLSQEYLTLIGERFPKAVALLEKLRLEAIQAKIAEGESDADAK